MVCSCALFRSVCSQQMYIVLHAYAQPVIFRLTQGSFKRGESGVRLPDFPN